MKNETLIKRYVNLGYEPKNLEFYQEIENIILWLYNELGIVITSSYQSLKIGNDKGYNQFCGEMLLIIQENTISFYCDDYFKNPYDAKVDALRKFYPGIKFSHFGCRNRKGVYKKLK